VSSMVGRVKPLPRVSMHAVRGVSMHAMPPPQAKVANCEEVRGPSGKTLTYTQMDQKNREKMYENQKNKPSQVRNQNVKSWYLKCSAVGDDDEDDDDADL